MKKRQVNKRNEAPAKSSQLYIFGAALILLALNAILFLGRSGPSETADATTPIPASVRQTAHTPFFPPDDDQPVAAVAQAKPAAHSAPPASTYNQPPPPGTLVLTVPGTDNDAAIPTAFAVPASDPDLNSDQVDRIQQIEKTFLSEVEAVNPQDPTYLARWQKAQAEAEQSLRFVIAQQDYLRYSLKAAQIDTRQ
jgi:hypothetical protein